MTLSASESREAMLGRIRTGNRSASSRELAEADWETLPRGYRQRALEGVDVLALLEDRLRDYDAHVVRCVPSRVGETLGRMLTERGLVRMLAAPGIQEGWLPEGYEFVMEDGLSTIALNRFEGVVTESTLAIAETGTVVLRTVPGQGRRAFSLIPDYHLCLVRASTVTATVPEAMHVLAGRPAFATTFISGPSATADIEMTRIKGVHGPRSLDVILVMDKDAGERLSA